MSLLKSKRAAVISATYFLLAAAAVILAFGKYPDTPMLFYIAVTLVFPWSFVAILASMLLIHVSADPLDAQLLKLMMIGVLINAAIIYLLTAWLERWLKIRSRSS